MELRRVESAPYSVEESFKWPAAGQMDSDTTNGLPDARADLEELYAQCFDLR